jgi:hypothetical protein
VKKQKKDPILTQKLLLEKEDRLDKERPLWSDLLPTSSSRENNSKLANLFAFFFFTKTAVISHFFYVDQQVPEAEPMSL